MPPIEPPFDLQALRARIPLLRTTVPMNGCSQAPQTTDTQLAVDRYMESWSTTGMDWDLWMHEVDLARATFARLIGAEADEVAVFSSVSHATAAVASTLDRLAPARGTPSRTTVALTEAEFPTVAHVWKAQEVRGTPLRWIPVRDGRVDEDALVEALDQDVLLLSATWGYYQTGALLDLETTVRAAQDAGVLTYVDAYQALGSRPLDVKALGVDMLARELAEEMEPAITGWFGRANPYAFDPHTLDWGAGARRFDSGTPPILPAYVARAGMELVMDVGLEAIGNWTRHLAERLAEEGAARNLELLGPADPALRAPTTAFRVEDSHGVEMAMRERGILPSARGPAIRLAPHYFNTTDDVDRALDVLIQVLAQ